MRSNKKLSTIYHRIMFGMSIADILGSVAMGLTTIPMPHQEMDNENNYSLHEGNTKLGNDFTCAAQGFFIFFGLTYVFMYNASLWTYYAYSIASNMSEEKIKTRVEPFLHLTPTLLSSLISSMPFFISSEGYVASNERPYCTLHDMSQDVPTVANVLPLPMRIPFLFCIISVFVVALTSFVLIIHKVWWTERNLRRLNTNNDSSPDDDVVDDNENIVTPVSQQDLRKNVRAVLIQASAYFLSYIVCTFLLFYLLGKRNKKSILIKEAAVLLTMQGFFNCVIFVSHKIYTFKQIDKNNRICAILWMLLRGYNEPIVFTRISMVDGETLTIRPNPHILDIRVPDRFLHSHEGGMDNESGLQMHDGSKNSTSVDFTGFDLPSINSKNLDVDNSESGLQNNMNKCSGSSRNDIQYL